jgi:LuxR family maltose regulon positive regulatory protein
LAYIEAISAGLRGLDRDIVDRLVAVADGAQWVGPTPDGFEDKSVAIAIVRSTFIGTDLSVSIAAARQLVGRQPGLPYVDAIGRGNLGIGLILAGDPHAALEVLGPLVPPTNPTLSDLIGTAARSLATTLIGDAPVGERIAQESLARAQAWGLERTFAGGAVCLALGLALSRQGRVDEAVPWLDRALADWGVPANTLHRAYALLQLAAVTAAGRQEDRARAMVREAREILTMSTNPGALPELLAQVERALDMRSKRRLAVGDMPTQAEMRVLRLLAGPSSHSVIARELFLSPNTVKTHVKAINRKLGTATRAEAVARAREQGLI